MKILAIDPYGESLDWCMRAMMDGHDVRWFIKETEKEKYIGKGLVNIIRDYKSSMKWADLVILMDNTLYLKEMDSWRTEKLIIGATVESASWELERSTGVKIFEKANIPTLPYKEFSDYESAIAYVKKEDKRFVSKPSNDADKNMSYVSKSPEDMIYMLERWKKLGKIKNSFILQEFCPGIEMAVGAWVGPSGFNQGFCENFEFKKLMNGDMGPATGEQGTVIRMVKKSKLADKVLKPLEDMIVATGHTGYVDVNCIVDEKGIPWPLEFTMRFGWPTFNIQQALHEGDNVEWLYDLATGADARNFKLDTVCTGVVLAIPDYPYSHLTRKEVIGVPMYGMTSKISDSVHPCQMMLGEAPFKSSGQIKDKKCLVTAGDYVLVATGLGDTVNASKKAAYKVLKQISFPNSAFFRTDIGDRLKDQIPDLHKHGYAAELEF